MCTNVDMLNLSAVKKYSKVNATHINFLSDTQKSIVLVEKQVPCIFASLTQLSLWSVLFYTKCLWRGAAEP